jgi:maltooligosyltrehalose trehalohydrolase
VDRAHGLGIAVVVDVVYNHFGPSGNYLHAFSTDYVTDRHRNEWGEAINFDGPGSGPVREFFLANAAYWIDEFHLDGLRLDATQQIFDDSSDHILIAVGREVRRAAGGRDTIIVAENEPQRARLAFPTEQGGFGLDGLWNDDFHHSALVAVTGHREAYYTDYYGAPQEFIATAKRGYLYQGQLYTWQKQGRGHPTRGLAPCTFVNYLQNHDQVANSVTGARLHQQTSASQFRAMTGLFLLGPWTPLLFQGQEFAASTPFLFFADHEPGLADAVRQGRARFLSQFPSIARPEVASRLDDPGDEATFLRSRLDHQERSLHAPVLHLHRDLLRLRREDAAFGPENGTQVDGAVLTSSALVLRFFAPMGEDDRLLVMNLGRDVCLAPLPEPLLAPPEGRTWRVHWSSEDVRYGGSGAPAGPTERGWLMPAESTVVFAGEVG